MQQRIFLGGLSFLFIALCGCAGTSSPATPIAVSVSPSPVTISVGKTQQFTATITGTSNTVVTWSVGGGAVNGTITSTGLYTAPAAVPNPPTATVTATSQADSSKSASATVTITTTTSSGSVTVSPSAATVANFGTQQFAASVSGVTWQVNGIAGGDQSVGFISASGLYVAPSGVPTKSDGKGGSVTATV